MNFNQEKLIFFKIITAHVKVGWSFLFTFNLCCHYSRRRRAIYYIINYLSVVVVKTQDKSI